MKLIYKSETKKIKRPKDYEGLVEISKKYFENLPSSFKFFYLDEQDIITISSQEDLESALEIDNSDTLKVYIETSIEQAKITIHSDNIMRASMSSFRALNQTNSRKQSDLFGENVMAQNQQMSGNNLSRQSLPNFPPYQNDNLSNPFEYKPQVNENVKESKFDQIDDAISDYDMNDKADQQQIINENLGNHLQDHEMKNDNNSNVEILYQNEQKADLNQNKEFNEKLIEQLYNMQKQYEGKGSDERQNESRYQQKNEIWKEQIDEDPILENQMSVPASFQNSVQKQINENTIQHSNSTQSVPQFQSPNQQQENLETRQPEWIQTYIKCFKCNGTGGFKEGQDCPKCNGKGILQQLEVKDIMSMLQSNNIEYLCPELTELSQQYKNKESLNNPNNLKVSHFGFKCSKCGANPINGIRYACYLCTDLNLCKQCEKIEGAIHPHPLTKMRVPEQEQYKQQVSLSYYGASGMNQGSSLLNDQNEMNNDKAISKYDNNIMQSQIIEENKNQQFQGNPLLQKLNNQSAFFNGLMKIKQITNPKENPLTLKPNEQFQKSWTFRNEGVNNLMPGQIYLEFTNGVKMGQQKKILDAIVKTGDTFTITVDFKAPQKEGSYIAFYQMFLNQVKVGSKVWCEIVVKDEPKVIKVQNKSVNEQEDIEQLYKQFQDQLKDSEKRQHLQQDIKKEVINQPIQQQVQKEEPKEYKFTEEEKKRLAYCEFVNKKTDKIQQEQLMALLDMGFSNFNINFNLIKKHKGDMEKITDALFNP